MGIFNFKTWVHCYVVLLNKLGAFRFSLLLAIIVISIDSLLQFSLAHYFNEPVDIVDISRSFILGGVIAPWVVYFLTVVVGDLEEARKSLDSSVVNLRITVEKEKQKEIALENEIIERQKSQAQQEQSAILLRSVIDTSPDLFFYRDLKGSLVSCNRAVEALTGKTQEQLIGSSIFDCFPESYTTTAFLNMQKARDTQEEQIYEHWLAYADGRKAYFEFRMLPLYNTKKECIGVIGFGRDITERKKTQESLEKASRDKTTFISTISHELRTPLNGIVGLSRMLLDEKLTSEQIKHLKTIHMSAITLGHIFSDIVDLDKLERQCMNLVSDPIDLCDFNSELKSLAFIQTEQKGLHLDFEQSEVLPNYIEVDATRLRQVLWNLLSNAVKFTKHGSITIRCFCEFEDAHRARICFEIQDSGVGIPGDQLDKIFAMYYQVNGQSHTPGTGIGLAISSQIVQLMGGELTVSSELGEGSVFKVSLPVNYSDKENWQKTVLQAPLALKILLVEDIELNIKVTMFLLKKLGHQVDIAKNGAQALKKVTEKKYQLILMDIQLPDMDGYQITKQLHQEHADSLPPIVALTANVFADKQHFMERGMDDVLAKPLGVGALNAVINRLFMPKDKQEKASEFYPANQLIDSLLDIPMLEELLMFIPTSVMLDNIVLFEKAMADYLQRLDVEMLAKNQDGIASEAHKIKSAAGSVGLKRIQALAQQIQSPDLPGWLENIDSWAQSIKSQYQNDAAELKKWVVAK